MFDVLICTHCYDVRRLITSIWRYCGQSYLFVCLFINMGPGRNDILKSTNLSNFCEIHHGCSASARNVSVNFWEVRVKLQGQNWKSSACNSLAVLYDIFILHQIWQSDRSTFDTKYAFQQNSIWLPGGDLHSLSAFSSSFIHLSLWCFSYCC